MTRARRAAILLLVPALCGLRGVSADELAVESWPLDDGTTALLVEDHRAPLVALRVVFPAGSWSPWARRNHLAEAFWIQRHDTAGELRAELDRLAVDVRLIVGRRACTLSASFFRTDLDEALDLVRRILTHRDFDRRELKRRRRERQISWRATQKQPLFVGGRAAARGLFAEQDPRRREWERPEPFPADVGALADARDSLIRIRGRAIGFAGDITRAEVERVATDLLPPALAEAPAGLEPDLEPLRPAAERPQSIVETLPRLTQVYFGYGRESVPYTAADYPAFVIADHVLGGHFYSRLYLALRHEGGETYGAGTGNYGDVVPGLYGMTTYTRTDNAEATEAKLREVLRRLHADGITEEERASAAGHLLGRRAFGRQSPEQVLDRRLAERRLGLPAGELDRLVERAAELSLDEINRFVARFFDPAGFSMVRVEPSR